MADGVEYVLAEDNIAEPLSGWIHHDVHRLMAFSDPVRPWPAP
jgi:hypothetical protein